MLHQVLANVELDRKSLTQNDLDIAQRVRTNPFPWTGQFSPQLVETLIDRFAPRNGVLLDPFVGSGTSVIEAARLGIAASGAEINPAAVVLSNVYRLANQDIKERKRVIEKLDSQIFSILAPFTMPLFSEQMNFPNDRSTLEKSLVDLWRNSSIDSAKNLAAALIVLCDFHKRRMDANTVHSTWDRLRKVILNFPHCIKPLQIYHADARLLPIPENTIDFVLTSPPYINVHNYHQQYRRSIESLAVDVLAIAPSEIGSNRKNRGNRLLTVIQYSLDIALALREISRTTRPGTLSILVLGRESTVSGLRFFNGEIVAEVAVNAVGMELERRQERVFRNRYGKEIYEDILHFRTTHNMPTKEFCIDVARRIAGDVLSIAQSFASTDCQKSSIEDALSKLSSVSPSPILMSKMNRT